jgi:hypothetical protein
MARDRSPFNDALDAARRALALAAIALVTAIGVTFPASGQDAEYRVTGVEVEATAADAVAARQLAVEAGQRQALRRLLDRLGAAGEVPDAASLPLDDLVASFEVLDETVGPTSYGATLAVAFDRAEVERLLDRSGVGYAAGPAEPTLLVPLWETGAGLRLWESENAWKAAWDRVLDPDALAPFVVPLGDLQDLSALNADQAARGDASAILDLARRYGTDEAVVARLQGSGEPGDPLQIAAERYGAAGEPYRAVVRRDPGEPLAETLERAVAELQAAYDARYRDRQTAGGRPSEAVIVVTQVPGLDAWGRLIRALDGFTEVEQAEVRRFAADEATLELRVAGGAEALQTALGRGGWSLSASGDDRWRLEWGGRAGASAF